MFVLIPHSTEELKLIKLQKQLISKLNNSDTTFISTYPLWIPLEIEEAAEISKSDLKQISKKIKNIKIEQPEFLENRLISKVFYEYEDCPKTTEIELLKDIKKSCQKQEFPAGLSIDFPMNLKIFRLGLATESEETHSVAIEDSVWCKLA